MTRLLIASAFPLMLLGCGSSAPSVTSAPAAGLAVDADLSDWPGTFAPIDDDRVLIGVRNDGERVIVAVSTFDRDAIRHTLLTGLTVWFDPEGGTDRAYGVQFPLGLIRDGEAPDLQALRSIRSEGDPAARLEQMLGELALIQNGTRTVYDRIGAPGILADASLDGGRLIVELSVPLASLDAQPGQVVGVGVENPELDRDALRAQMQARMGDGQRAGQGGGRRGAMGGRRGGERPGPPEPVEGWVRATLSD